MKIPQRFYVFPCGSSLFRNIGTRNIFLSQEMAFEVKITRYNKPGLLSYFCKTASHSKS